MKMQSIRRFLAVLLSMMMILGNMSIPAFGEEGETPEPAPCAHSSTATHEEARETDGIHLAGENVFTPYAIRNVAIDEFEHQIGILPLVFRGSEEQETPGILFASPDNEEGTPEGEAAIYIAEMQEEGCEFIIVYCIGATDEPLDPESTESPAEQMIRNSMGINLLILPEVPEDAAPPDTLTDGKGKAVWVLREAGVPTGCVLTLKEDSNGSLVCENTQVLNAE